MTKKSTMTKFVAGSTLYLKSPDDAQLELVLAWLTAHNLDMVTCLEGEAIFTPSGNGKPAHAIAIQFQSPDPAAEAKMQAAYPAPKTLAGIKVTDHDVTDPATDMPIAPINDPIQAPAPGHVSQAEVMEGTTVSVPLALAMDASPIEADAILYSS
jgi:hypothetical protein